MSFLRKQYKQKTWSFFNVKGINVLAAKNDKSKESLLPSTGFSKKRNLLMLRKGTAQIPTGYGLPYCCSTHSILSGCVCI